METLKLSNIRFISFLTILLFMIMVGCTSSGSAETEQNSNTEINEAGAVAAESTDVENEEANSTSESTAEDASEKAEKDKK